MRKWKDNIKMNLKELGREVVDWAELAKSTIQWQMSMNMMMSLRVP